MKELILEELSFEQKLGIITCGYLYANGPKEDREFTLALIRQRKLGAVWINPEDSKRDELIAEVKAAADYPISIYCDIEVGYGDYTIPQVISLGATGSDLELAYSFGKVTGIQARKMGYTHACNVLMDMARGDAFCGGTTRTMGNDKEKVAEMAKAIVRGMHDGGVLTFAKHYPGEGDASVDTHMQESSSLETEEELLEYTLYPYLKLLEAGLLDGVMPGHHKLPSIDPENPSSLSKPILDILRKRGFNGVYITDALVMMGIVLKYGKVGCNPKAVLAGNDLILPWSIGTKVAYEALLAAAEAGEITEDGIEDQVKRVLASQKRSIEIREAAEAADPQITEKDTECFRRLNEDCIALKSAPGVTPTVDKNGKHLFVMLVDHDYKISSVDEAPFGTPTWYNPAKIEREIRTLYPNSDVTLLRLFPSAAENSQLFKKQLGYDDVIYLTYWQTCAYLGEECLTTRVLGVMNALQTTNRIAAILHFGNPYMMEDVPRVDRIIQAYCSAHCVSHALKVLCGEAEAKGIIPYQNIQYKI